MTKVPKIFEECDNNFQREPFVIPGQYQRFTDSFRDKCAIGDFLGETSVVSESLNRPLFTHTLSLAKTIYDQTLADSKESPQDQFEPCLSAKKRSTQAVKCFFELSVGYIQQAKVSFPLAGLNKCIGLVAVPHSKLVLIAISQDKNPKNDIELRKRMVDFINEINGLSHHWKFELVCIPTKSQYLMPRAFFMRSPHQAPASWIEPPTRCVEVALMTALCKTGRFIEFKPKDFAVMAFGATLWASSNSKDSTPYPCFDTLITTTNHRNNKYLSKSIEINLNQNTSGWVDLWNPCMKHCQIYDRQMKAIAAAGGPATSFEEPRGEMSFVSLSNRSS